jgi:hypothetical protein
MRKVQWSLILLGILLLLPGCSRQSNAGGKISSGKMEKKVELPEYSPANPSPEMIKAAKILKPLPAEVMYQAVQNDLSKKAQIDKFRHTIPAAYEFFGTLTGNQLQHFIAAKEIRIPYRKLTPEQKNALDNWFKAYGDSLRGTGAETEDQLVNLYKLGAKRDLSNVDVGFVENGIVAIQFWVRIGGDDRSSMSWIAMV